MTFRNTRQAAEMIGVKPGTLNMALWGGRVAAPQRGPGGCYLWTVEDIEKAARVMRQMSLAEIEAEQRIMGGK